MDFETLDILYKYVFRDIKSDRDYWSLTAHARTHVLLIHGICEVIPLSKPPGGGGGGTSTIYCWGGGVPGAVKTYPNSADKPP